MKKCTYIFLCLCGLFVACRDDEDTVANREIFSIIPVDREDEDEWLILRDDETGDLVDVQPLVGSERITIMSTKKIPGDKLTVILFKHLTSDERGQSQVYSGVSVGSKWAELAPFPVNLNTPPILGNYSLTVTDVPGLYSCSISDAFGDVTNPEVTLEGSNINYQPLLRQNAKQLITIDDGISKPKYAFVDGMEVGETTTISYNAFKDFDKYVTVNSPSPFVRVMGYKDSKEYYYSYHMYDNRWGALHQMPTSKVAFGMLNDFAFYRINVSTQSGQYEYLGTGASSIPIDEIPDIQIADKSLGNFAFKDLNYKYKTVFYYTSDDNYSVAYHSSNGPAKYFDVLTPELREQYQIDDGTLEYASVNVTLAGRSYEDHLNFTFNENPDLSEPFETLTVYIRE